MLAGIAVSYALEFCGDAWSVLVRSANAFCRQYGSDDASGDLHEAALINGSTPSSIRKFSRSARAVTLPWWGSAGGDGGVRRVE